MKSDKYYKKTTDLILNVFRDLCGDTSFLRMDEISDRKNRIIVNDHGTDFSRENILFCDKFLFFSPSLIVTPSQLRYHFFNEDAIRNKVIQFKDIKKIQYSLMPCRTSISISTSTSALREIYDGVPKNAQTYADVKEYERAVAKGTYKARTICLLATIYALTALCNCSEDECESTYAQIERNIKQLVAYQKDVSNDSKKYGDFFSFDFVTCKYNHSDAQEGLDKILSVKQEIKTERREEVVSGIVNSFESQFEKVREQYESQKHR